MNVNRKIQLAAAAVIVNGVLALEILSPTTALAASCGPIDSPCLPGSLATCLSAGLAWCRTFTPPGCTFTGDECLGTSGCPVGDVKVACFYKAS
jgi:hypothetical protein